MPQRVLLVYPPKLPGTVVGFSDIPLSLIYLRAAIDETCEATAIFDFNVCDNSLETFEEVLKNFKPTIVGINCLFSGLFKNVLDVAKFVKRHDADIAVAVGGIHPTLFYSDIMENVGEIDCVFIGEGEQAFASFIRYKDGGAALEDLDSICLRADDRIVVKPKKSYIKDIDTIAPPYYSDIIANYRLSPANWYNPNGIEISDIQLTMLTSRSCPNQCSFCAMQYVMGNKYRAHSPERVMREIRYAYDTHGINYFLLMDDNFTFDRERAVKICRLIVESGMKIALEAPNGLMMRKLDDELIDLMTKAGFIRVHLAVESGSPYIRNTIMRKNISNEKMHDVIRACKRNNIYAMAFIIVGMPEDTAQTLEETIRFLEESELDNFNPNRLIPLPGTKLFQQCLDDDLFVGGYQPRQLWRGDFQGEMHMSHGFMIKPYQMTVDELNRYFERLMALKQVKAAKWLEHLKGVHKIVIR